MLRCIATLSTALLTLLITLGSNTASASHDRDLLRIHIPIHEQGPETLKLRKLIRHQYHLNLDHYRLNSVVVKNGRFSNGYASLRVGNHRSSRFFLPGRENIRIPSPSRARDHWRLRLGPGTQVRMVTVVLEPRNRRMARRYDNDRHAHRYWHDRYSYYRNRGHYADLRHAGDRRRARDHSRQRYQHLQHRKDRLSEGLVHRDAGRDRNDERNVERKREERKSTHADDGRKREARDLSSVYPRLRTHNG